MAVEKEGVGLQSGFVWDEASGYYYDAASGFYYDGNTGSLSFWFHSVLWKLYENNQFA